MTGIKPHIIPYIDQPAIFWAKLFKAYSPYIKEVYFPLPSKNIGSGRPLQPAEHLKQFIENDAIPKSILINPIVLPYSIDEIGQEIILYLNELLSRFNIIGVSVANLSLAKMIKKDFPAIEVVASTLMDIFTVQQVLMLDNSVDVIVPSGRILRDLKQLSELRACFGGKIRLIVNESCVPSCPYRTQHFFEMADFSNNYPKSLCEDLLIRFPWIRLTGSWILPQHLHFFEGVYDEIKIAGRFTLKNPKDYFEVLENYIFRKRTSLMKIGGGPASIPDNLNITDEFYEFSLYCDKKCTNCLVCEEYWKINNQPG